MERFAVPFVLPGSPCLAARRLL
ncbi:protein of unknown function [Methylacidimicrobium sp. AP8]|nr:protein of unknown function [Methylacidimicrobium sp. AP8]